MMTSTRYLTVALLGLAIAGCNNSQTFSDGGADQGVGDMGAHSDGGGSPDLGPGPYDWLQFGFDVEHSGGNPRESDLTATNVASLKPKAQVSFPAPVDSAPVYLSGVATANGPEDLLFVVTSQADLYALDASTLATVWKKSHPYPNGPCTSSNGGTCYTTSAPAIDPGRGFVYSYGLDGYAHKHAVADGSEVMGGGWPELVTRKPNLEKGSSDLAVAVSKSGAAYLYAASAGYPGDAGDYQGHLTTIHLADGSQKVFNTLCSNLTAHLGTNPLPSGQQDCNQTQSAVWARPGVIYRPDNDRIYFASGNGAFDLSTGNYDWGDSVFALAADGSGAGTGPIDSWTPTDQAALNAADADIGSTAPAILPTPATSKVAHLGLQGGKVPGGASAAPVRLLNLDDLSGQGGPGKLGGELFKMDLPQGNEILTQPTVWVNPTDQSTWAFIANDNGLSALQLVIDGTGAASLKSPWMTSNGGTSPIIAGGVLYYTANTAGRQGNNTVYALDPTTGNVLWSAQLAPMQGTTAIGGIHWESPIVAHGRLYITSEHGNSGGGVADGTGWLTVFAP